MGAAARLVISRDGAEMGEEPLEGEVVVGRDQGCVIRLDHRSVSRQHAVFKSAGGAVKVERKSKFGALSVNGKECDGAVLKEGDVIAIGPFQMRLNLPKEAPEPPPPAADEVPPEAPAGTDAIPAAPGEASAAGDGSAPPAEGSADSIGGLPGADAGAGAGLEGATGDAPAGDGALQLGGEGLPGTGDGGEAGAGADAFSDDDGKTKLTPTARVAVKLIFAPGAANVAEYDLTKDEVLIGRSAGCDIVLNDKKSSRKNTLIRRAGLSFVVKDLGSANGTFVNGVKVQEQELSGDDMVRVGDVEFLFRVTSAEYEQNKGGFLPVPEEEIVEEAAPPADGALQGMPADGAGLPADPAALAAAAAAAPAGADAQAGLVGVPGITGTGEAGGKAQGGLLAKWKAIPRQKKVLILVGIVALLFMWEDDKPKKAVRPQKKPGVTAQTGSGVRTFEQLTDAQKRFVESQHELAFDLYRNKEFDKALFEVGKIFQLVGDYKNAREIERYAKDGKRSMEAIEEEKRRKEEQARVTAKVAELTGEAQTLMSKKAYDEARQVFPQILALDPEHKYVAKWQQEIEDFEESRRQEEERKRIEDQVNKNAWEVYNQGAELIKAGDFHGAIKQLRKVKGIGAIDPEPESKAKQGIAEALQAIKDQLDPVLAEGREAEQAQDFTKAFKAFEKATRIDPGHPDGYEGMDRIRGVLHERAKVVYTEGVIAESFSDFETARKKFEETVKVAPKDDIYFERAKRKLVRYAPLKTDAPAEF